MESANALIENSFDMISLVDTAGKVLYASAASARVLGYEPSELVGMCTFDLIHSDDHSFSNRALREALEQPPVPRQADVRVRRKDGKWCWVESTVTNLLEDPRIGAIVLNFREIGARKAALDQQQQQTLELARSKAQLEDFAYAVAHDLRQSLRTISMFTSILLRETAFDERGKKMAQMIVEGAANMSDLFDGLHSFALSGFAEPPRRLDLGQVVSGVLQNLQDAIQASGAIITVGVLPVIQGNEKHLARVFENIIVNAIKYRSQAPVQIHVTAGRMGSSWVIRIKDNGIGIEPEFHKRIFLLLKRLHGPEIAGAGIGLAICEKLVTEMGGVIWVESKPGLGAVFCFTVAVDGEPAVADSTPTRSAVESPSDAEVRYNEAGLVAGARIQ